MKDRIYVATFAENAEDVIKRYGVNVEFNHICISECLDPEKRDATIAEMKVCLEKTGSKNSIIHGPFTEIIPGAIDHRAVEIGMDRLNEAYEVCHKLGVNKMVVHTGFVPLMYHKEWHLEKSKVFWKRFLENKADDFELYIENVFEDEPYLMKDLIDLVDDKRASICLDVGHANAMTTKEHTVEDWIEILGKRVKHIHIHNNDGTGDTHNSINQGSMDWKRVMEILDKHAAKGYTVTVESRQAEESVKLLLESR